MCTVEKWGTQGIRTSLAWSADIVFCNSFEVCNEAWNFSDSCTQGFHCALVSAARLCSVALGVARQAETFHLIDFRHNSCTCIRTSFEIVAFGLKVRLNRYSALNSRRKVGIFFLFCIFITGKQYNPSCLFSQNWLLLTWEAFEQLGFWTSQGFHFSSHQQLLKVTEVLLVI